MLVRQCVCVCVRAWVGEGGGGLCERSHFGYTPTKHEYASLPQS